MAKFLKKLMTVGFALCLTAMMGAFAVACTGNSGTDDEGTKNQTPETVTYTVAFNVQGHGAAPAAQTVEKDGYATKPATDPTETGYDFGGWYKEAGCENVFIFNTEKITADTIVYAKWTVAEETEDPEAPATSGAPLHFYDTSYTGTPNGTAFSEENVWVNENKFTGVTNTYHYNHITLEANSAVMIFWHLDGYEAEKTYKFDIRLGDDFEQSADVRSSIEMWYSVGQNGETVYSAQAAFGLIGLQVDFTEDQLSEAGSPMCKIILQNTSDTAFDLRIVCAVGDAH